LVFFFVGFGNSGPCIVSLVIMSQMYMIWVDYHLCIFVDFLWLKLSICSFYNVATQSVLLKLLFSQ
jgi:hypothetical protein